MDRYGPYAPCPHCFESSGYAARIHPASKRIMDSEAAAYERAVRLILNLEITETEAA